MTKESKGVRFHHRLLKSDMLRHGGVYFVSAALARLASFLLLPLYTRVLTPEDYGRIAILDLFTQLLAAVFCIAIAQAAGRFHFDELYAKNRAAIWWTSFGILIVSATLTVLICVAFGHQLSTALLGTSKHGNHRLVLASAVSFWFVSINQFLFSYVRIRKASITFAVLSLTSLALTLSLNVYFVALLKIGPLGVILGSLITNAIIAIVLFPMFWLQVGAPVFERRLLRVLGSFALPLVSTGVVTVLLQQSDRFFLRTLSDLQQVGVYSLAHKLSFSVVLLIMYPFNAIWMVLAYEIADAPDADHQYARTFRFYAWTMLTVLLGIAVLGKPVILVMSAPDFHAAASLVPVLCLGSFFFSINLFFALPARLQKNTSRLIPGSIIALVMNVVGNILFIPVGGAMAAAWVSAATFGVLAISNHLICRSLRPIPYPILATSVVLGMMVCGYCLYSALLA